MTCDVDITGSGDEVSIISVGENQQQQTECDDEEQYIVQETQYTEEKPSHLLTLWLIPKKPVCNM
jgi:hypothetical protein